ncbi:MAG: ribonuclease Y [Planctomycetes bacterium]|nr:ribonuclease Y [Planctomycetota bacterium]
MLAQTSTLSAPELISIAVVVISGAAVVALWILAARKLKRMRREGDELIEKARIEGTAKASALELAAERRVAERRQAADKQITQLLAEAKEAQERVGRREASVDKRSEQLENREAALEVRGKTLQASEAKQKELLEETQQIFERTRQRLSEISGLTQEQAREQFLSEVRDLSQRDAAILQQKMIEEAELKARERSREILLMSMQRYAGESATDATVRSVKIPSDDLKGRIIGREGRNIRTFERVTGVDVLIDDTPGVIAISCFDRVRQAVAVEALQRLVADGRVHPARIEEVVEQSRKDIHERMLKAGNDAAIEAGVPGLHGKIIEMMGRLHFRTSYGQNVLRHSIEVAFLSQLIADQLGLDGTIARRAGFLHDIGKAMDHEIEGGHPAIGLDFAKRHGEKSEAVLNAIGGHHNDIPTTTPYTPIVTTADALSGARPGARRESMEHYIKRLEQLEEIARKQHGVSEAYAIQAGREVRVIVNAKQADDARCFIIAQEIAKQVEAEMTFPGEIKVTVLREHRADAMAR